MTQQRKFGIAIAAATLAVILLAGVVYASTVTVSGTDYPGTHNLYSAMSVTDGGAGSYWGETYAEAEGWNVDTLYDTVEMDEKCNSIVQTDYYNQVQYSNVSYVDQTSSTVGYNTDWWDCSAGHGIRNLGVARWVSAANSIDWSRTRNACIDLKQTPCESGY